jgi:uncharacterized protein YdhG (YjbR/CyaY superfamily)
MKRDDSSPEAYRNDVEGELREMLEDVREVIFQVYDENEEIIEYGMLGYPGLANLAAQKNYVALYVKPEVLDNYRDQIKDCGKSCIRFRKPEEIDREMLLNLLKDVREYNK